LEHQDQIQEWLDNDLKKRIDREITRSRCLFLIGPTQLGILFYIVLLCVNDV
jgi:hypothetical protein